MEISTDTIYFIDTTLTVPFFGYQDALSCGYEKATTSCGMCAIAMILASYNNNISLPELIEKGHKEGGYGTNGWVHQYFIDLLSSYGITAERKENISLQNGVREISQSIKEKKPVIISGRKQFMEQTSFHMVLIVGIREDQNNNCTGFFYHDPAIKNKKEGSYHFVSIPNFFQYWRQMAIMLR